MRLAALGLAVAGCCPAIDAEETLFFDRTFTDLELAPMVAAVSEWALAMDRDMPAMFYDEPHGWSAQSWLGDKSIVHRMVETETVVLRQFWDPRFVGLASPGGSIVIAIERLSDPGKLRKVMRHELWHRFGCLNHEPPPSLRVGNVGLDLDCIDSETIAEVCDMQECGPDWGPTCQ